MTRVGSPNTWIDAFCELARLLRADEVLRGLPRGYTQVALLLIGRCSASSAVGIRSTTAQLRTAAAYSTHAHPLSVDLDRLEHFAAYFVDNAQTLFYLAA